MGCVLDESGRDGTECWKVANEKKDANVIRCLVNARSLQLECVKVLYEALLTPVILYSSKTVVWRIEGEI